MSVKECKSILIPVDFSPDSVEAVNEGVGLAQTLGADVHVLHVVHDPANAPGFYNSKSKAKKMVQRIDDAAVEMMADFVKKHDLEKKLGGKKLSSACVIGLPKEQILRAIKKLSPDLVVMGSSGKTGLNHILLGSVTERMVQLSPVPVLVVKRSKKSKS